jgi:hypothetical protein
VVWIPLGEPGLLLYYQTIVEQALSKQTENTPQTYKALEALILSNAETADDGQQIDSQSIVKGANIFYEFANRIKDLHDTLDVHDIKAPAAALFPVTPDLFKTDLGRQRQTILSEDSDLGFLFLPVRLLRIQKDTCDKLLSGKSHFENQLQIKTIGPLGIKNNTRVTNGTLPPSIDATAAQVYYITENGLNRIVSRGNDDPHADMRFYRNQFRASTVFPGRPYYIGAFNRENAPAP